MSNQSANQRNQEAEEPQQVFFSDLPLEFVVSVILGQGTEADTPSRKAFRNKGIGTFVNVTRRHQEPLPP